MKTTILLVSIFLMILYDCAPAPATSAVSTSTGEVLSPDTIPVSETPFAAACHAVFNPIGFSAEGNHLIGWMTIDGRATTYLQSLDLDNWTTQTIVKSNQLMTTVSALSPDRQLLAWALPDFDIQIVDLQSGKVISTLSGHEDMVNALVFSPDASKLYSGSNDKSVIVWSQSGNILASFQPTGADDFPSDVLGLGISPDGKTLITIPFDGNAKAWDAVNFQQQDEYQGSIAGSYNGAKAIFSLDGQFMVIGLAAGPGSATMWRVSDSSKIWTGGYIADFGFSPDNRYFAYGQRTEDGKDQVMISSPDTQTIFQTLDLEYIPTGTLLFSPDSTSLVVTLASGFDLWNVNDGRLLKSYNPTCS